jgi:ketosteroid isomerase-like protein
MTTTTNQTDRVLTETQRKSLALTTAYFDSMMRRDIATVADLFTNDVLEIVPLSITGDPGPQAVFEGKEQVMGYARLILQNFSQIGFTNQVYTVSADG